MKLSDYKYWPPECGFVLKQGVVPPHPNVAPVVTINVKHPDYQGIVAGNLQTDGEEARRRLHELLRTHLGLKISEIGHLLSD
jgi:hypothetical protein